MTTAGAAPRTGVVAFECAGFHGSALTAVEGALHTRLLPAPEKRARAGRILRESRYRVTSRVAWDGVGAVLLKVHAPRSFGDRLRQALCTGRAQAEWQASRYLEALGAPVAPSLAVGARGRGLRRHESFYVARFLDGVRPVHDVLPAQPEVQARRLHARLAALVRALHDHGFDHRDLHSGNVLAGPGPGEACRLLVTDLHRTRHGGHVSRRARRAAVARWLHSLRISDRLGPGGRLRWLRHYLDTSKPKAIRDWQRDVERRIRRLEHVRRRSRGKRCFKESTVYTRNVGPGRGARRRDLPPARIEAALAAHDEALQRDDERVAKRSRKGRVTRHGDLVVKERRARSWWTRLRDALAPGRHADGYAHAHMLGVLGVPTARPLASLRVGGRSYSLFEDLSHLLRLDHVVRERYLAADREAQARLRDACADWLADLHGRGIYHGDLKGVNVLVDEDAHVPRFHLIDTDRCRFFARPVDQRRRVKNLAQLAASIPICVTRTERLRWYRRYAARGLPGATERRVADLVAAQLASKTLVRDDPIE